MTILDIAPVRIGDHCMIGPGTVISTVGHPLTAAGRRAHLGLGAPVTLRVTGGGLPPVAFGSG